MTEKEHICELEDGFVVAGLILPEVCWDEDVGEAVDMGDELTKELVGATVLGSTALNAYLYDSDN